MEVKSIVLVLVLVFCATRASSNSLSCKTWKGICEKYENDCGEMGNQSSTRFTNSTADAGTNSTADAGTNSTSDVPARRDKDSHHTRVWQSCCELAKSQQAENLTLSGVYNVKSPYGTFTQMQAYCEMDGGWTVIQRRNINGTEQFNRSWSEFEDGFGDLEGEFWYGLAKIHWLTNQEPYRLRVDVTTLSGEKKFADYSNFSLTGELYTLGLGTHTGGTDFLSGYSGNKFTTHDKDNAGTTQYNCAEREIPFMFGGWWYGKQCLEDKSLNLNGKFCNGELICEDRVIITSVQMKIKPESCKNNIKVGH